MSKEVLIPIVIEVPPTANPSALGKTYELHRGEVSWAMLLEQLAAFALEQAEFHIKLLEKLEKVAGAISKGR